MDESWSYGRVVLAVVPASNRYLAAALGSAAFGFSITLVDSTDIAHCDVQTMYDLDTAPASTLTSDWECNLPSSVRLNTEHGQRLVEIALAKTRDGCVDSTSAHLFGVEGAPIGAAEELDCLLESNETYWLVPGIVRRYSIPLPDGPTSSFKCECRPLATNHVYTGRGGAPSPYDEPARPIWICTRCRKPTYGPEPEVDEVDSTTITGPDGEPVDVTPPTQPDQHEQAISAYVERHANYPWKKTDGP